MKADGAIRALKEFGIDAAFRGSAGPDVTGVAIDTRLVQAGDLFCCVRGGRVDGHTFAPEAIERGAVALLVDHPLRLTVPQIVVGSVRQAVGPLAAAIHGQPSRALLTIGVTGTNGKSSITHLLSHVLDSVGLPSLTIGTLNGKRTTPDAPELHTRLSDHRRNGGRAAAIEVSSHGLDQRRVDGTSFDAAIFTNLTHDHLDYHNTREAYGAAKARLFGQAFAGLGVINLDDGFGRTLFEERTIEMIGYRLADAKIRAMAHDTTHLRFHSHDFEIPMIGDHNISNVLAVITVLKALGFDVERIADALRTATLPVGRFQRIELGQPFTVVVDYAHTPDALEFMLCALRKRTKQRISVVFGCGGDRDPSKRSAMGNTACGLADAVYLTADNPRTEPLDHIITDVLAGVSDRSTVNVIADRAEAIRSAFAAAIPGDAVLLAGKGHERTQTIGDVSHEFHDPDVAQETLWGLGYGSASPTNSK